MVSGTIFMPVLAAADSTDRIYVREKKIWRAGAERAQLCVSWRSSEAVHGQDGRIIEIVESEA